MNVRIATFLLILAILTLHHEAFSQLATHWESRTPMPAKRSNMATASLEIGDTTWIFTFMGIDSTKACGSAKVDAWKYNTISDVWYSIASVPDPEGRIAASASGINGKIYVIGGYELHSNCFEFSSPRVDIYDPASNTWSLGDSIGTATDDHLQFSYKDSLVYCISGWSQNTNIRFVQIYDTYQDSWSYANNISGAGLFGLCGSISGDTILYLDGVKTAGNFTLVNEVWKGIIDSANPKNVNWTNIGTHPGNKLYRGAGFTFQDRIIFSGGTNNAYNFNGIGYNTIPSVESGRTFGYNLSSGSWQEYAHNPDSVMDVREIVKVGPNQYYVVGGMEANQTVSNNLSVFIVDSILTNVSTSHFDKPVSVYPNPFNEELFINNYSHKTLYFQLFDFTGKILLQEKLHSNKNIFNPKIAPGIYFYQILNPQSERISTGKIIRL